MLRRDAPFKFASFDLKLSLVFARHIMQQTNEKRVLFSLEKLPLRLYFSGCLYRSYVSNNKKGLAFHLWVGAWSAPC